MNRIRFTSMLLGGVLLAAQSPHAARDARPLPLSSPSCANPRGMRLIVRSFFIVSNSADGFQDNVVEVHGAVYFNGQKAWSIARKNAIDAVDDATDRDRRKTIRTGTRTYDVIFNNPSTWKLRVSGYLHDRDRGSDDDVLWNLGRRTREVDIKDAYEQQKAGRQAFSWLPGDHKSESADLRFVVTKVSDIF